MMVEVASIDLNNIQERKLEIDSGVGIGVHAIDCLINRLWH